jgi:hypothetical protein
MHLRGAGLVLLLLVPPVLALSPAERAQRPADGWVVLPVQDYQALRAKAYPPERQPEAAPVASAVTRIDYDLTVAGETAVGEARLTVDVLHEGWVQIGVPAGLLIREARIADRPVSLVDPGAGNGGAPYVLISRAGRTAIVMDVAVPLTAAGGSETLALPASAAAVSRAALVIPRQGIDLTLSGGFLAHATETPQAARYVAHGRPGEALVFSWRRRVEEPKVALPLRLRGSVVQLVSLGEDGAQVTADVNVDVLQGSAATVRVALPDGLVVNDAAGPLVAEWDVKPGALEVTFLEPVTSRASFRVSAEARLPREGVMAAPLLRLAEADREAGGVAVEVLGSGEITDQQPRGLDPGDASELGGPVAGRDSPSLAAFRFRAGDGRTERSLAVRVARYTPEAVLIANVEEARYEVLAAEDGKVLVRARYAVRNNQRSFLALALPPQATLWSASVSGRATRPGRSAEGALLLPLEKARAGDDAPVFAMEVVYLDRSARWAGKGQARLTLPALDLPVSRTGVVLHHSPRFRVAPEPGDFRPEDYTDPGSPVLTTDSAGESPSSPAAKAVGGAGAAEGMQVLVERFQKEGRVARVAGALPVQVPFPPLGPSLFLASELTAEGRAPSLSLAYAQMTKGGL